MKCSFLTSGVKFRMVLVVITFILAQQTYSQVCGTTNIALGQPVTASASINASLPGNLTNGIVSSTWVPPVNVICWAYIDLGSSKTICKVNVKWARWNFASSFKIQISNTPATEASWVTLQTVTNNNPPIGFESASYWDSYVINELIIGGTNNTGRYVRILLDPIPSTANVAVSEMEVFQAVASNSVPGCSLVTPSTNVTIAANTALELKANAQDNDGTIAEVAFYNGGTLLGIAPQTTQPFLFTWIPTTPGTYQIRARAKDNLGDTGTSLVSTVTVIPANPGWGLLGNSLATSATAFLGTTDTLPIIVKTNNIERYRVTKNGQMLVGSTALPSSASTNTLLSVNGSVIARSLKITQLNWPDYVFAKNYQLMSLDKLAKYIQINSHLPGVPSAKEVAKSGLEIGASNEILLRKIEELTLYILKQQKEIDRIKAKLQNEKKVELNKNKIRK